MIIFQQQKKLFKDIIMQSHSFFTFLLITTILNASLPCIAAQKSYDNEPQAKRQRQEERNNNQNHPSIHNPRAFFTAQTEDDVKQARAHGCQLNLQNIKGHNALHHAITKNNLTVAKALMACDQTDTLLIKQADNDGFTPLHLAAKLGNLEAIKFIYSYYPNSNLDFAIEKGEEEYKGYTPLHLACLFAKSEIVEFLLNKECSPNVQGTPQQYNKDTDYCQGTALTLACSYDGPHANTPEINTTIITIINMILAKYPNIIDIPASENRTALYITCNNDNDVLAQHLLAKGANPNIYNSNQNSPLHLTCQNNMAETVQCLLEYRANPSIHNGQEAPLSLACQHGNPLIIALLLQHGANVHIANKDQHTPTQILNQFIKNADTKAPLLKLLYAYGAHTYMQEHNNDLIATCIRHINTNHAAFTAFLHTCTPEQLQELYTHLPTLIEFACAADQKACSNKNLAALQKTFPRYTASYKPGYIHIAQLYRALLFKNKLHMMQQNKVKCNVMFEFLN